MRENERELSLLTLHTNIFLKNAVKSIGFSIYIDTGNSRQDVC